MAVVVQGRGRLCLTGLAAPDIGRNSALLGGLRLAGGEGQAAKAGGVC